MTPIEYQPAGTWDVIDRHGEPRYVVEHDGKGGWWGVCQPDRPEDCYVLAASKELLAALKVAQFDCRGRCPACAGWNCSEYGETDRAHTNTCPVSLAIAKAEGR